MPFGVINMYMDEKNSQLGQLLLNTEEKRRETVHDTYIYSRISVFDKGLASRVKTTKAMTSNPSIPKGIWRIIFWLTPGVIYVRSIIG
jgi:hypothetical protein